MAKIATVKNLSNILCYHWQIHQVYCFFLTEAQCSYSSADFRLNISLKIVLDYSVFCVFERILAEMLLASNVQLVLFICCFLASVLPFREGRIIHVYASVKNM